MEVNPQDMLQDPVTARLVQRVKHLGAAALIFEAPLEIVKEAQKMGVRVLVFLVGGTPMACHTGFLVLEMGDGVDFNKIDQVQDKLGLLAVEIGVAGNALQTVEIINQRLVL